MRKIITNILMVSAILVAGNMINSCSKVEDIIEDISIPIPFAVPVSFQTNIPLATVNTTDYVTYPEVPLNLNLDEKIKEKYPSLSINNLKSAKLASFSIQYISSTAFNLDAIKNAEIYIKTPSLEQRLIATVTDNTLGDILTFTPTTTNNELLQYLKSSENSLILRIQGSKVAADIIKVKIDTSFKIEVGL